MSSGLMGDAEKVKFVWGKDTLEKAKLRYLLLKKTSDLSIEQRVELIVVLYGIPKNELAEELNNYIMENFPEYVAAPLEARFKLYWEGIISREMHDLKKAAEIMKRGKK